MVAKIHNLSYITKKKANIISMQIYQNICLICKDLSDFYPKGVLQPTLGTYHHIENMITPSTTDNLSYRTILVLNDMDSLLSCVDDIT